MAGIPKPHGNGWRVRWQYRRNTEQAPVDDFEQGMRLKAWLEAQGDDVSPLDPRLTSGVWDTMGRRSESGLTFGEWFAIYNKAKGCTARSKHEYENLAKFHLKEWWDLPLRAIDRDAVDALIANLCTKKKARVASTTGTLTYAPNTIYDVLRLAAGVLKAAHGAGKIDRYPFAANPEAGYGEINMKDAAGITALRMREDDTLYLTSGDFLKLVAAADVVDPTGQLATLLTFLIETGVRIGEALALRVGNCRLDVGAPFIRIEFTRLPNGEDGPPKKGKKRTVALGPRSVMALQKLTAGRPSTACVFRAPIRGDKGYRYSNWHHKYWAALIKEARDNHGLDRSLSLHPHALRYNHATWARDNGADPLMLAESMGHASLLTTKGYTLDSAKARKHMAAVVASFMPAAEMPPSD